LSLPQKYADTMILAWLKNPSLRVNMDDLALRLFNYETLHFESLVKKGENFASVELEKACKYAAEDAYITLRFYLYFLKNLEPHLLDLAKNYEFDFIKIIMMMEENGIKLDTHALEILMKKFESEIKILSEEIYDLCEDRFNLNSPKQVGDILFEKLKLPSGKKGKTGYSTDEKVLNELLDKHPVISKILDYRELAKLYSTYCEPLLKLALKDENSRIYSSFLQTGTATGRLSSKDPNLQNIPAHGQYAKDYKSCFIAKEGFSFISLDYSQIELRMLAHFSEDEKLLNAFKNDEDIHARTAIMIFGESNYETRSIAKSINFGLIYGMGYKTLSKNLKIEANLAKTYIEKYFENFTSIKSYFEKVKNEAKANGFISTLSGRKRYFDFENAKPMQVAMYERESINSILQGSAADIIKFAMLEIAKILNQDKRLILQIHDELIFEVKDELCENFVKKTSDIMENIVKLKVKLKTSSSIAKKWGNLK
ncbi:DNA polymerase, partial [Campylobacter coli]